MANEKNPGVVSDTPFKYPSVSRSDVLKSPSSNSLPIKGGITIAGKITKSEVKGQRGNPPGGYRKSNSSEPVK